MRPLSIAISLSAVALAASSVVHAEEALLAAGAGYRRPISEIATAFEAKTGHKILQTYGHMGQVIAQAKEGGRIAVVCGDRVVLDGARGLAFERMIPLGTGRLVVAWRKGLELAAPAGITDQSFKRIAVADQTNAIFGKAARQYLDRVKLYDIVESRIIGVSTVPQVTSYVASGEVDAGFVNATDAIGAVEISAASSRCPRAYYESDRNFVWADEGKLRLSRRGGICRVPRLADGQGRAGAIRM
ncbi:MAG: substrate-binding domain-containing protein [Chryseolinea sp.]